MDNLLTLAFALQLSPCLQEIVEGSACAPRLLLEGPQGNCAGWIQCLCEDLNPH